MAKKEDILFQDLDSHIEYTLLQRRVVYIADAIDTDSANDAIRKLWYLEATNSGKPITIVISSPGGSVDAGFAVWDQAKLISCPITTIVTGLAASMGSVLSLCADRGCRFATPNARIMIHQPSLGGGMHGQATDLQIQAKEILRRRAQLVTLYANQTGRSEKEIDKAIDRDHWMTAREALEFGLLDKIISNKEEHSLLG